MSNSKRRKLPLSKISSFAEQKEANPPLSLTIQTYDSIFFFFLPDDFESQAQEKYG